MLTLRRRGVAGCGNLTLRRHWRRTVAVGCLSVWGLCDLIATVLLGVDPERRADIAGEREGYAGDHGASGFSLYRPLAV